MVDTKHGGLVELLNVDRTIHEPARLAIMTVLAAVDSVDFKFFERLLHLSKGNLSSHLSKLEDTGYINVSKSFRGRVPHTRYSLTSHGRSQLAAYWDTLGAAAPAAPAV